MSTQYTIHPVTFEVQPPLDSADGHLTAATDTDTDNLPARGSGAEHDRDDTTVDPGYVDYHMAGSDDELVDLGRGISGVGPGAPSSPHAKGDDNGDDEKDDEEQDTGPSDEERTTPPLPRPIELNASSSRTFFRAPRLSPVCFSDPGSTRIFLI